MSDVAWSNDRVSTLSKLWQDGLSASQIAKQLGGVTRNAVIGKVHRLGLSGRAAPARPSRSARITAPRPRRLERPIRSTTPPGAAFRAVAVSETAPEGPGLVADMTGLTAHVCRWPIGDPKTETFSFCGRAAVGRYCAAHERLGTRAGTAWRAEADPVVRRALAGLA
jgi:GcrA cell cycle regulator